MKLTQFAQMRGFENAYNSFHQHAIDSLLNSEQGEQIRKELLTKRLQFDCLPELHAEVESICGLLDCSKREFLQMAVQEAIEKAQSTFMDSFKEVDGRDFCDVYAPAKGA